MNNLIKDKQQFKQQAINFLRTIHGPALKLDTENQIQVSCYSPEPEMYSQTALPIYVDALSKLASQELTLFSRSVTGKVDNAKLAEMAFAGIRSVEQFIVLLRRKLMLRAIQELREESNTESTGTDD